jgi:mannose-1-phosphate guanylyltransferase/mannose-6-phosphate isomerase
MVHGLWAMVLKVREKILLVPVILAGGVGSRLWPLSREHYPKQFIPLLDAETSLLQSTLLRLKGLDQMAPPIIVCNDQHRFLVAEQLRQVGITDATILLEPVARNTAPAITLAAYEALSRDKDPVLLVLAADHLIKTEKKFHKAIAEGRSCAERGELVTFGVKPDSPETGYGYIRCASGEDGVQAVESFVEKPDASTAQKYLDSGDYFWNSGMFMFQASTLLEELGAWAPDILQACEQAFRTIHKDLDFHRISKECFDQCRSESIDYAVMEKTSNAVVVPLSCEWSDVGAWSAIWNVTDHDENGNVAQGDVLLESVKNTYLRSESRLVAALDVEDLVVVETADAVLVANKHKVQNIKKLVDRLKGLKRSEAKDHTQVYRPWGSYENIVIAPRFQAKRIIVNPGASLSLQLHHHRAEHWVVVKGCAEVTRGEDVFQLNEDESTYIPIGMKHRLGNPGIIPLEIIEVQTGSYLGEDDIIRFDDNYGRTE